MVGFGATEIAVDAEPRGVAPLAGAYRADGFMIIGLGIAQALALMAVFGAGSRYGGMVGAAALLFSIVYVLFFSFKGSGLNQAFERSGAATVEGPVSRYGWLVRRALLIATASESIGLGSAAWLHDRPRCGSAGEI